MFRVNRLLLLATLLVAPFLMNSSAVAGQHASGPKGDVDPKTGMRFPPRAGAFERRGGIEYDDAGYRMATYFAGTLGYASAFYYKNLPFAAEYANARDAVRQKNSAARLISDRTSNLHAGGRRAVFTFEDSIDGRKTTILSELLMFPRGDYYLTFRITYLANHGDRMRREIDTLVRAFKL